MSRAPAVDGGSAGDFRAFLARDWGDWIQDYPEAGTVLGMPGMNDRWTDDSDAGIERRRSHLRRSSAELATARPGEALGRRPLEF